MTTADATRPSRRFAVIALLFATYFLTYLDRAVIATAMPFIASEFALSSTQAGLVLSAFFFGYAVMQIPSGILADRFGPGRLLTIAVTCWSIFTAATGLVQSFVALVAVRVLFGISEGPAPASVSKAVALWASPGRVGQANGVVLAATLLGGAAAPLFVASFVAEKGWRPAFIVLLVPGVVLALAIYRYLVVGAAPVIGRGQDANGSVRDGWAAAIGSRRMRWCLATTFLASAANWALQNWLPTYLLRARGFDVTHMGVFASMSFAAGAFGYVLGGLAGDRLFADRRHVLIVAALLLAAASTFGAATAPGGTLPVALMAVAFLLIGVALSCIFTLPLLLVPARAAGTAFGVVNTGAQVAGFLSPLLIGAVLDASGQDFVIALYVVVALLAAAGLAASRIGGGRTNIDDQPSR